MRIRKNAKERDRKTLHEEWLFKHSPQLTLKEYMFSKSSSQEMQKPEEGIDFNTGHLYTCIMM